MKNYISILIGAMLMGGSLAQAQDYDDIYYDSGSSKKKSNAESVETQTQKTTRTTAASRNPYFSKYSAAKTAEEVTSDTMPQIINGRDVDEYNRRYTSDQEAYYAEENAAAYIMTDSVENEDFVYTDRIVKYHNEDLINDSEDAELVELYYETRPSVNIIVGSDYYGSLYDYYWGGYPYYYSSYWYRPWRYGWYSSWYDPWYDPWYYSYGWYTGWYSHWGSWGWGYPYYGGYRPYAHHHPHYAGGRPHISDGGRYTAGNRGRAGAQGGVSRPGYATASNRAGVSAGRSSGRATTVSRGATSANVQRSGTTVSRPGSTGMIRRSVGNSGVTQRRSAVSTRRSDSSSNSYSPSQTRSYNSQSRSSYSSGSSYSGGRSSGSFSGGGGRSSGGGGGGGRGGRR